MQPWRYIIHMWRYILFLMRYFILRDTAFLWISFEVKLFSFCFEYLGFCCIIQRKPYKRTHFSILHAHTRKEKRLTCVHRKSFLIYYTAIVTENYIHIFDWTMWYAITLSSTYFIVLYINWNKSPTFIDILFWND